MAIGPGPGTLLLAFGSQVGLLGFLHALGLTPAHQPPAPQAPQQGVPPSSVVAWGPPAPCPVPTPCPLPQRSSWLSTGLAGLSLVFSGCIAGFGILAWTGLTVWGLFCALAQFCVTRLGLEFSRLDAEGSGREVRAVADAGTEPGEGHDPLQAAVVVVRPLRRGRGALA